MHATAQHRRHPGRRFGPCPDTAIGWRLLEGGDERAALAAALTHAPPDGGVWTGPKAAAWMSEMLGHAVHPQRGWEALRRLGWTSKVPRPRHAKADPGAQAAFKKTSRP